MPLALLPLRSNSTRLPGKNIRPFLGKPLLAWTIETARASGVIDHIVVATDGPEIAACAQACGADACILLPPALTTDTAPVIGSLAFAARECAGRSKLYQYSILLEVTSFRLPVHISRSLHMLEETGADSVVSVIPVAGAHHPGLLIRVDEQLHATRFDGSPVGTIPARKQDLSPLYTRNGAIYAFRTDLLLQDPPTIYGTDCRAFVMPAAFDIDIDTLEDFEGAEKKVASFSR